MEKALVDIRKIFQNNKVVLAFLFGSAAKGKTNKLSDLDFAVLLDKTVNPAKYQEVRIKLLDELGRIIKNRPIDVITLNQAPPLLAQLAATRSKVIYCQNEDLKINFQTKTLKSFDDALYLRKTFYHYLEERVKNNQLGETNL